MTHPEMAMVTLDAIVVPIVLTLCILCRLKDAKH